MDIVLTKTELIDAIYEKLSQKNKADIKNIVETLLSIMKSTIKTENTLLLSGFGKFEAYSKNMRTGRNPYTEQAMLLVARKVVVFRISKKFRLELNT